MIFSLARTKRASTVPAAVGAYIGAGLLLHELRQLRQSRDHVGRIFSNTFAGIAPASVPGFVVAQLVGGACAILLIRVLYPDVTPRRGRRTILLPHHQEASG